MTSFADPFSFSVKASPSDANRSRAPEAMNVRGGKVSNADFGAKRGEAMGLSLSSGLGRYCSRSDGDGELEDFSSQNAAHTMTSLAEAVQGSSGSHPKILSYFCWRYCRTLDC